MFISHPVLDRELEAIRTIMRKAVTCRNAELSRCIAELMDKPGKMLRPTIVMISAHAALAVQPGSGQAYDTVLDESFLKIAAAIEILHMATLVHDDVIDKAATRRGIPSAFARYGAKTAVLVGDLLFSSAFQLVADQADSRQAASLASSVKALADSEILQLERMDPEAPELRRYIHQIIGKTAVLFVLSSRSGAEHAHADARTTQLLQRAAYNIGMAFQIIDDTLDFDPPESGTGKLPGVDVRSGLLTMPLILALKNRGRNPAAYVSLKVVLSRNGISTEDIGLIADLVKNLDGFELAKKNAGAYTARALREIARLEPSEARTLFTELTTSMLSRTY